MRCEEPVRILEILRLTEFGYSQRKISASVGCAKTTVGEVQRRSRVADLSYEQASVLTSEALQELLYPAYMSKKYIKADPDFDNIHEELRKHPKLNLQFLWEEYKRKNQDGLEYSQFCERYNRWKGHAGQNVTMHQELEAGKELFIDWMGDKLPIVIDSTTGEILEAHFFVSTLGNSGYPYVEAFTNEKQESWLLAHVHALTYYGGVPLILVPDNCKTAISKPNHYDPVINPAYWELAKHYNVAVIPARIRSPQDKAQVEQGVGWLETWLLGWLRNQQFFSFGELNKAIRYRLSELVQRPYQKRPGTRLSVFNEFDRPQLRPLAHSPFEVADMKLRTVPDNYHIEYANFYYSVLYTYYRQKVTIRATSTSIEIFDSNRVRIASHPRRYAGKRYVTDPNHMPEHHRKYWDAKQFNGSRYRTWAGGIGENTLHVIKKMLTAQKIEEQAYKSCMGLLQMSKKYSPERLEAACTKAIFMNSCSYTTIANILKNGQDLIIYQESSTLKATPEHENVRGAAYYS